MSIYTRAADETTTAAIYQTEQGESSRRLEIEIFMRFESSKDEEEERRGIKNLSLIAL